MNNHFNDQQNLNGVNKNFTSNTPPQRSNRLPIVITKEKETYQFWLILYKNFPKVERFGIGKKIDSLLLSVLEITFTASYLPPKSKIVFLGKAITRLDVVKFFVQLAWENKLIPNNKYLELSEKLEEIGRMLGGWKKGLEKKTSTN